MRLSKEKILLLSSVIIGILILELISGLFDTELPNSNYKSILYKNYSEEELNRELPFRHPNNGGNCVHVGFHSNMQWHPRFGFNDKTLDLDCVEKLFGQEKINVVFLGGSAMANYETPNYLTSIEYYMFKNTDNFRSINLSESGARLSNELSIFIEYIPKMKLKPDFVVFLDGYNEFNSIRYNGKPDDDFYWTASVKERIHAPFKYYLNALLKKSNLYRLILVNYQNYFGKKLILQEELKSQIFNSVDDYLNRKEILENLCKIYEINCIFVLQPIFILSDNLNGTTDKQIQKWHNKYFKNDKAIYELGYKKILSKDNEIFDLSTIFDNNDYTYLDYVHFNKIGSKIIGENLIEILKNQLN